MTDEHDRIMAAISAQSEEKTKMYDEITRLRAENEKLRAAGEGVVKWLLEVGRLPFDGAPYAVFALREALGDSRDKAALEGNKDEQ